MLKNICASLDLFLNMAAGDVFSSCASVPLPNGCLQLFLSVASF